MSHRSPARHTARRSTGTRSSAQPSVSRGTCPPGVVAAAPWSSVSSNLRPPLRWRSYGDEQPGLTDRPGGFTLSGSRSGRRHRGAGIDQPEQGAGRGPARVGGAGEEQVGVEDALRDRRPKGLQKAPSAVMVRPTCPSTTKGDSKLTPIQVLTAETSQQLPVCRKSESLLRMRSGRSREGAGPPLGGPCSPSLTRSEHLQEALT